MAARAKAYALHGRPKQREFYLAQYDDGSWSIREEATGSIFPTTLKTNAKEMIARLMQLLDVGPTRPQTHPERIGINSTQEEIDKLGLEEHRD